MKKFLLYIIALFFAISCGNSYEEQKRLSRAERARLHREDSLALKIAVMPTLDCLPLYLVKEHVLYDTAKLDLRLKYFTAQMDCDTAVIGRSVEGAVSDLVRTERMKHEGVKLDYITSTNAYWQLITNHKARIKKVDQLGDKRRKVQMAELIKTYNQACDSINQNGIKHYAEIIKKYMKTDEKTISQLPKIKFAHVASPKQDDINTINRKK